jgi:predicted transport protein
VIESNMETFFGPIELQPGFSRDGRGIGHFGTGGLELRLKDSDDLARAEQLLFASYEVS